MEQDCEYYRNIVERMTGILGPHMLDSDCGVPTLAGQFDVRFSFPTLTGEKYPHNKEAIHFPTKNLVFVGSPHFDPTMAGEGVLAPFSFFRSLPAP